MDFNGVWLNRMGCLCMSSTSYSRPSHLNNYIPPYVTNTNILEDFGVLESVKAAADLYSPMSGEVVEVNTALEEEPELINKEPYGKGTQIAGAGYCGG